MFDGHSGIRWELIEKMGQLLRANITPLVPLYVTISASGGTCSYTAGTLIGIPSICVFDGPPAFGGRKIVSSCKALDTQCIAPIPLASKQHFGILNGTAFSSSVAAPPSVPHRPPIRSSHSHGTLSKIAFSLSFLLTDKTNDLRRLPTYGNILEAMHWLVRGAKPNDSLFLHCMFLFLLPPRLKKYIYQY